MKISGRELDAAVAERVMGFRWCVWPQPFEGDQGRFLDTHWEKERAGVTPLLAKGDEPLHPHAYLTVPAYSTDIVAAMQVLDKADGMWELTRRVERETLHDEAAPYVLRYRCHLRIGNNTGSATGCETAMEAICRAALAAWEKNESN